MTPRQLQLLTPSTLDTYRRFIRDARARARRAGDAALLEQLREDVEVLPDGASRLLWIGDRARATRFVYFLHGGGYMVPATRGHLQWCLQSYVQQPQQQEEEEKVAVAVLQYTLTPAARFPTQMLQAAAGLRHLLVAHRIRPGQIVVGGDSAGGNLTIQLLTHLLHPYPAADAVAGASVTVGEEPLAGAFLVSPFTSGKTNSLSFRDGKPCDMLSLGIFDQPKREMFHEPSSSSSSSCWPTPGRGGLPLVETQAFREGRKWALPGDVDDNKWLDGMDRVVKKVYVTCGRHEILRDQGIEMAEVIRRRNSGVDVRLEVADKEAHDFMLLEGERRLVGDATTRMRAWFRTVWV